MKTAALCLFAFAALIVLAQGQESAVELRRADALSWRIRCDQLREFFFQRLQLAEHAVILGIGDFRIVENVVTIGVVRQLLAKSLDFGLGLFFVHKIRFFYLF